MPIITLQRRLREVGRIRLGVKVPITSGPNAGKSRPKKIETFRITSKDERVIAAVAQQYGGEVAPWEAPDGPQFEVLTEAMEMPCVVPPGDMGFSQWMELWQGERCARRCDGQTEYLSDSSCICLTEGHDGADRPCNTTSRLSLLLPDIPAFGLWRLETHGYYGAVELAGVVELCQRASQAGNMLPARLRLEQRTVKRFKGNKPVTYKFAVPVLDLDISIGALGQLNAGAQLPVAALTGDQAALAAAGDGTAELPNAWKPVGALPEGPTATVAEQLAEVEPKPKPDKPRKNAAEPIKPTGLKPKGNNAGKPIDEGEPDAPKEQPPSKNYSEAQARSDAKKAEKVTPDEVIDADSSPAPAKGEGTLPPDRALAARARELGIDDDQRHGIYLAITGGARSSGKSLTPGEVAKVFRLFGDWDHVRLVGDEQADGSVAWTILYAGDGSDPTDEDEFAFGVDMRGATAESPPADSGPPTPEETPDRPAADDSGGAGPEIPASADAWRALMGTHKRKLAEVFRAGTRLAGELELDPPRTIDELAAAPAELQTAVVRFIEAGE